MPGETGSKLTHATILKTGDLLPESFREAFFATGTSGAINIPGQIVTMVLEDYQAKDLDAFYDIANFRVALCKTFMIVSPSFKGFNFDIVWSPAIAKSTGEPILPADAGQTHLLFNFVLADGLHYVRGIRSASIAPNCGAALYRAQHELMNKNITEMDVYTEMTLLFSKYPNGFPSNFFHEICALGD
jgi:hypothetical protein